MIGRSKAVALVMAVLGLAASASRSVAQDEETGSIELTDVVNVNDADVSDLMEIPGMDPELARLIVQFRRESGPLDSLAALYQSPLITPARLYPVLPWLSAERTPKRLHMELLATVRSSSLPVPRSEGRLSAGIGGLFIAARHRRGLEPEGDESSRAESGGVLRLAPVRHIRIEIGDAAPVNGFGLLLGVSSRPPTRGALAIPSDPAPSPDDGWLRRGAPAPDGRFLRGASLEVGSVLHAALWRYYGGPAAASQGDEPIKQPQVLTVGLSRRRGRDRTPDSGIEMAPRAVLFDGAVWTGVRSTAPRSGGRVAVELARDPLNRFRVAVAAGAREGRRAHFRISHVGGSRLFVNPLGHDSERAPLSGDLLASGRNENRNETALFTRLVPVRRIAVEVEARGAVEGATLRRSWDRPVGTGIVRLEATPGRGWSLSAEARIDTRGAPGPSADVDAPLRRHAAKIRAGWVQGGAHLRAEWLGRFDVEVPPGASGAAPVTDVQDLVSLRARWPVTHFFWVGGGLANYRLPSAAPAVLYEERPFGLTPGVFVRGTGERAHIAAAVRLRRVEGGLFAARTRDVAAGDDEISWGTLLRLRTE